ncbi:type VI secretion system lipoprotein TssJ [Cronobacter dublinensis]|nr:type VI secretion system lipoprotein TssJ [Cronobacter dublinensis]EKF2294427.1 type VI secretion system lipoprotein TssJ [Cronobacter dublinensis]EKF2298416.1 type VI secretion system lipoprotein TssJ [Cronobacter dublinensis]EKK5267075.1 type VI secretion system lipoprotein TssJ [Cronobacter dublinensis]EKM0139470.1 type VI secretion system lipoprotein TssJ [Cronobacter dublinensis]
MTTGLIAWLRGAVSRRGKAAAQTLILMLIMCLVTACHSVPPEANANQWVLNLSAGAKVNPNARGVASPLKVTIYKLNTDEAFLDAGYLTLMQTPDPELQAQMQKVYEGILRPNEKRRVTVQADNTTHALGIVAAYRDIEKARWSEAWRIPETPSPAWYQKFWPWKPDPAPQHVDIAFDKLQITINGLDRENE